MISVIIPTYKEPDVLDLCLRSVLEGQHNQNEIIVVVDGFYELNKPILDKYPQVKVINLPENKGATIATNWGVYQATNDYIMVVNDDNVFAKDWDLKLEPYCKKGQVISINQIEPRPSMFRQFHIKDLGIDPTTFDLNKFWEYEQSLSVLPPEESGSTYPFLMYKYDYLAIGGLDELFPSPHVVDWELFLKCEYFGMKMLRVYDTHLYHFASVATRRDPEMDRISSEKEAKAHKFFRAKWGQNVEHNPIDNSKLLSKFK